MNWRERALIPLGLAILVTLSVKAEAQFPGEIVYGPTAAREEPGKRVVPVTACPDGLGGFVTAGTSQPAASANSDVYVVRTLLNGHRVFEVTYDVGGVGGADTGTSIAALRDGSGFAVTGSTNLATANTDVLLMKIDCAGRVVWATHFVNPAGRETGYDVIEASTGTPTLGTSKGDLVVAGYTLNGTNQTPDGFLIRTRSNGSLIWNRRYDFAADTQFFRALTEARPTAGASTGDIVAVGDVRLPGGGNPRALSVRVNGNNGLFTSVLHCAAARGTTSAATRFDSVVELTTFPWTGALVMAGSTQTSAWHSDLYLVRTGRNVCAGSVQRHAGFPAGGAAAPFGDEAALDVREVLSPLPIAPVGTLVLTGRAGKPGSSATDAFLHTALPASLVLQPGAGRLFGDHAGKREGGSALWPFGNGIVIAGVSESDFEGVGDARDLYLIGTNGGGKTGCERPWPPPQGALRYPTKRLPLNAVASLQQVFRPVVATEHVTEYQHCP
jgi:hypothetical protein